MRKIVLVLLRFEIVQPISAVLILRKELDLSFKLFTKSKRYSPRRQRRSSFSTRTISVDDDDSIEEDEVCWNVVVAQNEDQDSEDSPRIKTTK